jgi:hypothetical protein
LNSSGGEEVFEKTIERDKRKAELAMQHGIKLFAVTEHDNQDDLIQKIYEIIEKRKILPPSN